MKTLLTGTPASKGKVQGKVKIILDPNDNYKLEEGDILVTVMTNPLFVPAMKKAVTIVTDVGSQLCHAAIVSRELGIPCVVATKKATKILKNGMEVIVDGGKGKIYQSGN